MKRWKSSLGEDVGLHFALGLEGRVLMSDVTWGQGQDWEGTGQDKLRGDCRLNDCFYFNERTSTLKKMLMKDASLRPPPPLSSRQNPSWQTDPINKRAECAWDCYQDNDHSLSWRRISAQRLLLAQNSPSVCRKQPVAPVHHLVAPSLSLAAIALFFVWLPNLSLSLFSAPSRA